jgi:fucose permease
MATKADPETLASPAARAGGANESLEDALQQTLDEARMVQPGIQALFGFQLIAVFNDAFERHLSEAAQSLHLAALLLVTIAIALVMTPAAYHRQVQPRQVTQGFLVLASGFVSGALLPLAAGLALDVHLVARVITASPVIGAVVGGGVFALLIGLWFVYPQWHARERRRGAKH